MRSRGSPSFLPFLNFSRSWPSQNKIIAIPHPKRYYTNTGGPNHDAKWLWFHSLALEFSLWMQPHRNTIPPQPTQSSKAGKDRWVHYTALGLWRDASQDQIKRRYYELSKEHHPDVSQDPSSPEIFRKVTEAYAVLGKKKTRRKYDQYEQLQSAIITGLRDQQTGQAPSSSPRPLDPTFWDPIKSGSSTLYRPPAGYWAVMNKIVQEGEKERLKAQAASSSPQTVMPSHDRPEKKETLIQVQLTEFELKVIITLSVASAPVFVVRLLQENNKSDSESSDLQGRIEDLSQTTDTCTDA